MYQRKKGRDLFDVYHALTNLDLNTNTVIECYREYMAFSVDRPPTPKQFIRNMDLKMSNPDFQGDIYALLRPEVKYNQREAYDLIRTELIERI